MIYLKDVIMSSKSIRKPMFSTRFCVAFSPVLTGSVVPFPQTLRAPRARSESIEATVVRPVRPAGESSHVFIPMISFEKKKKTDFM